MCVTQKSTAQRLAAFVHGAKQRAAFEQAVNERSPEPSATFLARLDKVLADCMCARAQYHLRFPKPRATDASLRVYSAAGGGIPMRNANGERRRADEVGDERGFEVDEELLALLRGLEGLSLEARAGEAQKHLACLEVLKAEERRLLLAGDVAAAEQVRAKLMAGLAEHRDLYLDREGVLVLPFASDSAVIPDCLDNLAGDEEALGLRKAAFPSVREVRCSVQTGRQAQAKSRGCLQTVPKAPRTGNAGMEPVPMLPEIELTPMEDGGECAVLTLKKGVKVAAKHAGELDAFVAMLDAERPAGLGG